MATGPCGPCAPNLPTPFGGPASGLWPSGSGIGPVMGPVGPIVSPDSGPVVPPVGPPAVDLGLAAFFKILAKTAITNVPTSVIIGNVGLSPNAAAGITGFSLVLDGSGQFATSSQVSSPGKVYAADYAPGTPAMLTAAVLAMQAAYTDAASRPANFTNVSGGLLGGLTLHGGVYKFTTGVTIATDLVLAGGANDTFIFQIDGTFAMTGAAKIILSGGVQKQNVVWQIAGATTIGPGSIFQGTLLDQTSIALQAGAEAHGKLFAQTAVTLIQNFVNG
jgi:Ice-binding-like